MLLTELANKSYQMKTAEKYVKADFVKDAVKKCNITSIITASWETTIALIAGSNDLIWILMEQT